MTGKERLYAQRRRKVLASTKLLRDQIKKLDYAAVPRDDAAAFYAVVAGNIAAAFERMCEELASRLVGAAAPAAFKTLTTEISATLGALSETKTTAEPSEHDLALQAEYSVDLDALATIDLHAQRAGLQARKYEIERQLEMGESVHLPTLTKQVVERFTTTKQRLLAIPTRAAPRFAPLDQQRALALLVKEIKMATEPLRQPWPWQ